MVRCLQNARSCRIIISLNLARVAVKLTTEFTALPLSVRAKDGPLHTNKTSSFDSGIILLVQMKCNYKVAQHLLS